MIEYTGTFKVIRQIVEWINNFVPSPTEDPRFEVRQYTDIDGNTVNATYQVMEDNS